MGNAAVPEEEEGLGTVRVENEPLIADNEVDVEMELDGRLVVDPAFGDELELLYTADESTLLELLDSALLLELVGRPLAATDLIAPT